ncbi:MAG: hypothetical protein JWR07_5009 [Nevskia sp.]|nr:hypothetical protein [Nevskia sp.]
MPRRPDGELIEMADNHQASSTGLLSVAGPIQRALLEVGAIVTQREDDIIRFEGGALIWRPIILLRGGSIQKKNGLVTSSVRLSYLTIAGLGAAAFVAWIICWVAHISLLLPALLTGTAILVLVTGWVHAHLWLEELVSQTIKATELAQAKKDFTSSSFAAEP